MATVEVFGVGERVAVLQPNSNFFMAKGTITEDRGEHQVFRYRVRLDGPLGTWLFRDDELTNKDQWVR